MTIISRKLGVLIALTLAASPVIAQEKVAIATSANPEVAALFVAHEEGFFSKRGLDTDIKIIALNPTIPASLLSNSIQIGAPTPTVFAQAVDNGLDLVTIAGVSTVTPNLLSVAVIAKPEAGLTEAKNFTGKTVAVPGLNAVLHMALQLWLEKGGADPKRVRFVEAPLPTMGDILKAGQVDAVIAVDPFLTRIVETTGAKVIANFLSDVAVDQQTMFYVTTRDWAAKNPRKIEAFRAGLTEAAEFIAANPDKAREDILKFFKIPPEAAKRMAMPKTSVALTSQQVVFWGEVMKRYGLVQNPIEAAKVMVP